MQPKLRHVQSTHILILQVVHHQASPPYFVLATSKFMRRHSQMMLLGTFEPEADYGGLPMDVRVNTVSTSRYRRSRWMACGL